MANKLIVELIADTKDFTNNLRSSTDRLGGIQKAAGVASAALTGGLVVGLGASVKAAEEAQQSTARLDQAFRAAGVSVGNFKSPIEDAESASRKLGFTNSDVQESLGSLVIATHSGSKAISDLSVAENIARFKHTDLTSATKMLAMAMTGSQRAVKQLGLQVQASTTAQDAARVKYQQTKTAIEAQFGPVSKLTKAQDDQRAQLLANAAAAYQADKAQALMTDHSVTGQKIIQEVTDKLHGQAQAYSDTAAGGMAQFHAQMNNLEEMIGKTLVPALTKVTGALAGMLTFLSDHTTAAKVLLGVLGGLAATLITVGAATKIWSAAQVIAKAATVAWTGVQWALNAALEANPIGAIVVGVAALVAGLVVAYKESKTFRDIVNGAFDSVKGVFDDVVSAGQSVVGFFTDTLPGAFKSTLDWVKGNWSSVVGFIENPFTDVVSAAKGVFGLVDALTGALSSAVNAAKNIGDGIYDAIKNAVSGVAGAVAGFVKNIPTELLGLGQKFFAGIQQVGGWVKSAVIDGATGVTAAVVAFIKNIATDIVALGQKSFAVVEAAGRWVKDAVVNGATGVAGDVVGFVKAIPDDILGLGQKAFAVVDKIGDWIKTAIVGGIEGLATDAIGKIKSAIKGIAVGADWIATQVVSIGTAIADGILSGIGNLASDLTDSLKSKISSAVGAVKGFFKIGSPSKVIAEQIGKPLAQGILVGFNSVPLAAAMKATLGNALGHHAPVPSMSPTGSTPTRANTSFLTGLTSTSTGQPSRNAAANHVTVQQFFTQQPDDPWGYLQRSKVAAVGVFAGA